MSERTVGTRRNRIEDLSQRHLRGLHQRQRSPRILIVVNLAMLCVHDRLMAAAIVCFESHPGIGVHSWLRGHEGKRILAGLGQGIEALLPQGVDRMHRIRKQEAQEAQVFGGEGATVRHSRTSLPVRRGDRGHTGHLNSSIIVLAVSDGGHGMTG
jgi:hypothetical protein